SGVTHRFIDTHCHFDFPPFAADEVGSLGRAAQAGVGRSIVPAISAERFSRVLALAAQHEALYAALGMHPIVIEEHTDEGLAQLEALM
ncbi:TatD family hydrolase, partial [Mycobacterium tuberculosis]|nr:TatD family hydrolase [Mycobacterium tuberculosis]